MECKRAECVQEYQVMVHGVADAVLEEMDYRHCEADGCHTLYLGEKEGDRCAYCELALCGSCAAQDNQGSYIDEDFLCVECLDGALQEGGVAHCENRLKRCTEYVYRGAYSCKVCKQLLCAECSETLSRGRLCMDCNK